MKDRKTPHGPGPRVTRRRVLGSAASLSSMSLMPLVASSRSRAAETRDVPRVLEAGEREVLDAFVDTLVPADENGPGALEAGAAGYIEGSLAQWNAAELAQIQAGMRDVEAFSRRRFETGFSALDAERRVVLLSAMEEGQAEDFPGAQALFNRLHRLTLEGMFSDPYYGGNRRYIGWDLIGYPGAVLSSTPDMQRMGERLPPLHTSAYGADYDGD